MLIVAVLCLCAAVVIAGLGIWLLSRPRSQDPFREAVRGVAPTQLAAAAMLAAGGAVAFSAPAETSFVVVIVCVIGAVGTVAAGCWQAAKAVTQTDAPAVCGGACASCTLSCS